jgi:hypothetical protein
MWRTRLKENKEAWIAYRVRKTLARFRTDQAIRFLEASVRSGAQVYLAGDNNTVKGRDNATLCVELAKDLITALNLEAEVTEDWEKTWEADNQLLNEQEKHWSNARPIVDGGGAHGGGHGSH